MKVFFSASLRGKKLFGQSYKAIYNQIETLGHKNLDKELIYLISNSFYKEIENKGEQAYIDLYKRKIKSLAQADICIFECSTQSFSIGYQIERARDLLKPIIILYQKDYVPHFLSGIKSDSLIIAEYTKDTLSEIVKDTIYEAKQQRVTRFNFFVSPSLISYVEQISRKQGRTKSAFIRNLIKEHKKTSK